MNRQQRLDLDGVPVGVEPVLFYSARDKWGAFSNFSAHKVVLTNPFDVRDTIVYTTSEHRYQAMKATNLADHRYVVDADTAFESKVRGGPGGIQLREGWGDDYGDLCYYVMFEVVMAKARQHPDVMSMLEATGDRPIYEDSPLDDIWGWRYRSSYRGKNLLGIAWMEAREYLFW